MDTLKQDRFTHDLHRHEWNAVVIDESHNVTGDTTQNNRLARTLAPNTDALILASATRTMATGNPSPSSSGCWSPPLSTPMVSSTRATLSVW